MKLIKKWLKARYYKQAERFLKSNQAHLSFSQQGEDLEIERQLGDKTCGFYVDVGAFHPVKYSNTFLFYLRGWRGINIEANPDHFHEFNRIRKEDINLNLAISDTREELTYYKLSDPAINSFSLENTIKWTKSGSFSIVDQVQIKTVPLSFVLEQNMPVNQTIDFMSVDAEGMDLNVLKSNNWSDFRPRLLLVEENLCEKKALDASEIYRFLVAQSYEVVSICGITLMFKDKKYNA